MNNTLESLKQNKRALEESIAHRQKAAQDAGTTAYDLGTQEEQARLAGINVEIDRIEQATKKEKP